MNTSRSVLRRTVAGLYAVFALHAVTAAAANDEWPATVVRLEDLSPAQPLELYMKVPGVVVKGKVKGPAIVKAHVDSQGQVTRVVLVDTCGNPDLDEAAMHALRSMEFKPYTVGGQPTAATLVVPVHVPAKYGRAR